MRTAADRTLELLAAQVGRPLSEVETPVAVVDLDRLEANLQRSAVLLPTQHGIALWPHTKTHKSPEIGLRQLELGAGGLTVAKTGEAQVFQEAGAPRILVHYPPFGADKWERLADLAADGLELTVAVDGARARGGPRGRARSGAAPRPTLLVEMDVGPAPHGADDRRGRARARAGALAPAGRRGRRHQLLPGSLPRRCGDHPRARRGVRRAAARGARRLRGGRAAQRPHLGRLDADPLPDARDVRQRSCGRAPTRCSIATTGPLEKCALWVEVTVISDCGARADRDRRRLQDADLRRRIRTAATARSSACRAPICTRSTRSTATSDVAGAERAACRARRPPAGHPEPRLRLRQPARGPARRTRRRRRSRDRASVGARPRALATRCGRARARRAARRSRPCSRCC